MQIRSRWRLWCRFALQAILLSWWWGASIVAVLAHEVVLLHTEPSAGVNIAQSPPMVKLWFAEELQESSHFQIFNDVGESVNSGMGAIDLTDPAHAILIVRNPTLPVGIYTVCWQAILIDGDVTTGSFAFGIGREPEKAIPCPTTTNQPSFPLAWHWLVVSGAGILLIMAVGVSRWRHNLFKP